VVGQPTLRRQLKLGVLAALDQRIDVRYHLDIAGRTDPLFSDDAITCIHDAARGKPRTVNNLTMAALVATYTTGKTIVDESATRATIAEVIATE
jgi:type II secretory pathway predicted ATPase ExeA